MKQRILWLILVLPAFMLARTSAARQTALSNTIQSGQSVYIVCYQSNGEPDRVVEDKLKKAFEKQKRFNLVLDAAAADFIFLAYVEYGTAFFSWVDIRAQDYDRNQPLVQSIRAFVIPPARFNRLKGNQDALCDEAIWIGEERKGKLFIPDPGYYTGKLAGKFHKETTGAIAANRRICRPAEPPTAVKSAPASKPSGTLKDAAKLDAEAAKLYDDGEYNKSAVAAQSALAIREANHPLDHPDLIAPLGNLARARIGQGEYAEAEWLLNRALALFEVANKDAPAELAGLLNQLASLSFVRGDFETAENFYRQSLAMREKALPPGDIQIANSLNNLATLLIVKGDPAEAAQALTLLGRARQIAEQNPKANRRDQIGILTNLATLNLNQGNATTAESLYLKALDLNLGWRKGLNKFMDVARILTNTADDYRQATDKTPNSRNSTRMEEGGWANENPFITDTLNNLGLIRIRQSRFDEAAEFLMRANNIQRYLLGTSHPSLAATYDNQAMLARAAGKPQLALSHQRSANEIRETNLRRNLVTGSERQKLMYLTQSSARLDYTLSLHLQDAPSDEAAAATAFTALLRHKGRALDAQTDAIARLRRNVRPQDQTLLDQLLEARTRLSNLIVQGETSIKANEAEIRRLEREAEKLEEQIGQQSAGFRALTQAITPESIQSRIPAETALVEYAIYRPVDPFNQPTGPPRYAAYVMTKLRGARGIDLGKAPELNGLIDRVRNALRDPKSKDYKILARVLDERIFQPVRNLVLDAESFLIAPAGRLNLLPLGALVNEKQEFLVDRYSFTYLTSGRDLLRLQDESASLAKQMEPQAMILADPDFGERPSDDAKATTGKPARSSLFANAYFSPLPATAKEAAELKAILPGAIVLTGKDATENVLKSAPPRAILHIATHGFFFDVEPVTGTSATAGQRLLLQQAPLAISLAKSAEENPLLRSGLGLAGANLLKSGNDDGILTAMEASALNLSGTKLVALSACDTGVGEVRNGEGVYGLRRALQLAGAETQVMSLWPVSDQGTSELMIAYYQALQAGQGRGEAMRQVQIKMRDNPKRQHPYYWAGFIVSGEWANLEGKR
jgi:CHAT domain-containing protein/peptidoglycan hydrolase-like protein with peptidoglycan-binding domain